MPEKNLTKSGPNGLAPVTAWVAPRVKTSGDTVGNTSGVSPNQGKDPEASSGRIDTAQNTAGRKGGKHTQPDVPSSNFVTQPHTRPTPEANTLTNPLKGK